MQLIDQIRQQAVNHPEQLALRGEECTFSYGQLLAAAEEIAEDLQARDIRVLGLYADNGPNWLLVDLACQIAQITLVPLPVFFSQQQLTHTLRVSGMQALLSDSCERFTALEMVGQARAELAGMALIDIHAEATAALPEHTAKITFTSGSTGTPRGVCLSARTQFTTASVLARQLHPQGNRVHLCLLPLATLLENVAGAYSSWLRGGEVVVPTTARLGLSGSSGLDVAQLASCIDEYRPHSVILLPQMLKALLEHSERNGWQPPSSLRFVAVGGGKVSDRLLLQARSLGLPVYEGYGLSECGSVVALNVPGADRPGSVGRPLSHCDIAIRDGEVMVRGPRYLGYLDSAEGGESQWLATGDLGELDAEGFLHITGRCKNILISAFGRNISPEWIESEVLLEPIVQQCVVVGDARPHCAALIFARPGSSREQLDSWLQAVNRKLPDYAQVRTWTALPAPLTFADGLLTANGRPRRDRIAAQFQNSIDSLYGGISS
ncbi:AMP-binding protein [Microbulbifer sp. VAAC004]|uniref:AMP-binding protein n=1 Tax=unclassified Microbulbifer TaxID=2619833 RepID=UPI004039E200